MHNGTISKTRHSPARPSLVSNMIQAQVMEDHEAPVVILELACDVSCDVVVHLCKVLMRDQLWSSIYDRGAYRYEKARCSILAIERLGEQLEPGVVAVHEELSSVSSFELGKPGVLHCQRRRSVALVEIKDQIDE